MYIYVYGLILNLFIKMDPFVTYIHVPIALHRKSCVDDRFK